MADDQVISQSTVDAFMAAPKEKRVAALGKMSIEAKQSLLTALKNNPKTMRPGFPAAPGMPEAPLAARAVHQAGGFVKEAGRQTKNLAEGALNVMADVGGADLAIDSKHMSDTPEQKRTARRETNEAAARAHENPAETAVNAAAAAGGMVKDAAVKPFHDARGRSEEAPDYDPAWASRAEMFISSVMGGDVDTARDAFSRGDYGKGQAALLTAPVLTTAAGEAVGGASELGRTEVSARATGKEAAHQAERLASIQGPTGTTVDRVSVAQDVQPLLKQWMGENGYTDSTLHPHYKPSAGPHPTREGLPWKDTSVEIRDGEGRPTGKYVSNLRKGARNILDAADGAVDISNRPFVKVVGEYANESPVITTASGTKVRFQDQIASSIEEKAKMYDNPADTGIAQSLRMQADEVRGAKNIGEVQRIKARANKTISSLLKGTPGQQAAAGFSSAVAWKATGDSIREIMYPELEKLSGVNMRDFGAREASAMRFRDGVYRHYFDTIDPAQASEAAIGYLGGVKHGYMSHHGFWSKVARLNRSPAGEMNYQFRKGVGELGEGARGETISVRNKNQLALPAPADMKPYTFRMSTGLPEEVISGQDSRGGSVLQDWKLIPESGTAAPTNVMHTAPAAGSGGTVTRGGGGFVETANPSVALSTRNRLERFMKTEDFDSLPHDKREAVRAEFQSLDSQLRDHRAYSTAKPPRTAVVRPYEPGVVVHRRRARAYTASRAATRKPAEETPAE